MRFDIMSDPMVILGCLGLGDAFLCNAILRHYAKDRMVVYPCWFHNHRTLTEMFSDATIAFHPVAKEEDAISLADRTEGSLKLGYYNQPFDATKFDQEFYRQAGLEFEKRWTEFKMPEMTIKEWDSEYSWCHHDESRGFKIDKDKVGKNPYFLMPNTNLKSIVLGMFNANEIHVINSCMLILADSVATPKAKRLVLHHYSRKTIYPTLRKNWQVI